MHMGAFVEQGSDHLWTRIRAHGVVQGRPILRVSSIYFTSDSYQKQDSFVADAIPCCKVKSRPSVTVLSVHVCTSLEQIRNPVMELPILVPVVVLPTGAT